MNTLQDAAVFLDITLCLMVTEKPNKQHYVSSNLSCAVCSAPLHFLCPGRKERKKLVFPFCLQHSYDDK